MKISLAKALASISLLVITYQSNAADSLVFQCNTSKNKTITISRSGNQLYYTYGTDKKNDIKIKEDLYSKEIQETFSHNVNLANKSGPYIYNSVTFENGEYAYNVTVLSDINVPSDKTFSGVYVIKSGSQVARIRCKESTIKDQFESLYK